MLNVIQIILKNVNTIFRHAFISAFCASTEFIIFILLYVELKNKLIISQSISFLVASMIGFIGHSIFTFKIGALYRRNALYFAMQISLAFIIGYTIIYNLILINISPALSKIIQLILVFIFNITFGKLITFKKNE